MSYRSTVFILFMGFLFYSPNLYSVVHYFDLGDVTAKGKVTSFPSALGWIEPGLSFSASASVLEQKSFDFNSTAFGTSSEPMTVKPSVLASGLGQSWGGWSMVITNQSSQINTRSETLLSGNQSQTKLNFNSNLLSVFLGTGIRISENWSLGMNLNFFQNDNIVNSTVWSNTTTGKTFLNNQSHSKLVGSSLGVGFTFDYSAFTFGLHFVSPMIVIKNTGILESEYIETASDIFLISEQEEKIKLEQNNGITEFGIRFGKQGFVYILSDQYSFVGSHKINLGFEYAASWGIMASGFSHYEYGQSAKDKLLVGFARTKSNFHWAVGPYFESELLKGDSGYNARSLGVLYASEIQY
ncbi:MAG: hypothetical protein J0M15_13300 [Deltaproteobacteria bacterium]|nr:hypothetical protein [Deltaproteobacteria bacterium]